ncbi:type II toxin-antitoxin system RelE/ParE family toxin [Trichloromonas acetexigens]|jgi:putative addiction module killer protein|uniref:Type II toxin-antitoxin system RelE/ParE family toxin n=1 Tax=Trichloromonas acetexigens TaxID=38815 RepID=A0A550JDE5_9BACT|nr:type II toxin-antitoxin system RelE/ParE family toxin [Desulfuromonas acetexigens]TRO81232.1 type II toxin-antitoxin system RelE/ParE family toxin [Desulfuromonas acetexigens]
MQTYPYDIEYYIDENGNRPFKDWLEGMRDVAGRAKLRIRLDRARLGNLGDNRSVGEGVRELRVDFGPGYRVYFALDGAHVVLLLLGGDKSSQTRDIAKAKEYWQDYQRRRDHGQVH